MDFSTPDRDILRGLAEEVARIASLPEQRETAELWRRLNRLEAVRPMVHIYQVPWKEIEAADPEPLRLHCASRDARGLEYRFRSMLYQWRHFPADLVIEPKLTIGPCLHNSGFGLDVKQQVLKQTDAQRAIGGSIQSHKYEPQISDEADIDKIRIPAIAYDADATRERVRALEELLDGTLEVDCGIGFVNIAPWDLLVQWTGVERVLMDLALRPDFVHAVMEKLTRGYEAMMDAYERLNLLRLNNGPDTIGQGGLGYTDELPGADFDPERVKYSNQWGGGMAQIFAEVSPAMHREFALAYEARCLRRFALVYYGCCEPLHNKVDLTREMLPNVRKISMSPMADDTAGAAAVGDTLVYSAKPNPANVATDTWSPDLVRRELTGILEKTAARGCHVELVLKDISTIRSEPRRLAEWSRIAVECAERFAG